MVLVIAVINVVKILSRFQEKSSNRWAETMRAKS